MDVLLGWWYSGAAVSTRTPQNYPACTTDYTASTRYCGSVHILRVYCYTTHSEPQLRWKWLYFTMWDAPHTALSKDIPFIIVNSIDGLSRGSRIKLEGFFIVLTP